MNDLKYVKIKIRDEGGKFLQHHYIAKDAWDFPAGRIEEGETPIVAVQRELLERTGYSIDITKLIAAGSEGDFYIFTGAVQDIQKVAEPGEKGGYSTTVRWQ